MKSILTSLCLVIYILFNNGDIWKIDKATSFDIREDKYSLEDTHPGFPFTINTHLITFPDSLNDGVAYIGNSSKELYSAVLKALDGEKKAK